MVLNDWLRGTNRTKLYRYHYVHHYIIETVNWDNVWHFQIILWFCNRLCHALARF